MKKFNYSKTYYKVTNENECHHGYQYKDGLNVLNEPFNEDADDYCGSGGFYFTNYENLPLFLDFGIWIREVKIPEDARVIKINGEDKWRTDKIILLNRYHIYNDFEKWFKKDEFNYERYSNILAKYFSNYFDVWWDEEKFNWLYSDFLAKYCNNQFEKWWNPEKFKWYYSYLLTDYCSDYFDIWWDPDKFNWNDSRHLVVSCYKHFKKWWYPDRFEDVCKNLIIYLLSEFKKQEN